MADKAKQCSSNEGNHKKIIAKQLNAKQRISKQREATYSEGMHIKSKQTEATPSSGTRICSERAANRFHGCILDEHLVGRK